MADDNTIIEGSVKFRDGKKWKQRWCVMRRLSPVADCVQLQLYRSARGRGACGGLAGGRGAGGACASLALAQYVGAEAGFTLDKHSNTLALVCRDLVAVLAFETRERLIQWQVKVNAVLGTARAHMVVVRGGSLQAGPARLLVRAGRAALTAGCPPKLLALWELQHLRRYGVVDGRFCLEGGALCGRGEGLHVLVAERPRDIARDFERAARGDLSPRRLADRTDDDAEEHDVSTPSMAETPAAAWGGAAAGAEDTASLRGAASGTGVALERCMSCMSKLGAMSRSSTAALTPGATFSPAWTMEAVTEPREALAADPPAAPRPLEPPPERPARPARLDLPRCACDVVEDAQSTGVGPYENYDVPRVPSTEIEGEYYDTPKRLRECIDGDLFKITRSSTANALILKKPCGCLLRFGRRRREPTVVDAEEELAAPCPCRRVTDWANAWIKLPYCRRNTAPSESIADKENVTPDAEALYATIDFSRKTRRKASAGQTIEIDDGPLAHYENLNFALSLEYYENAKDLLQKAGVTQRELDAIGSNLRPAALLPRGGRGACRRCGHGAGPPRAAHDEYLVMEPPARADRSRALPAGYTPMSPIGGFAFHTLKHPTRSPITRILDEKSASNPTLCAVTGGVVERRGGARGVRPRSSSADSSRFLDEVKEFDGSVGGSASSLETLRDAGGGGTADGKLSDVDSLPSEPAPAAGGGGARDSSSSNDSGVSECAGAGGGRGGAGGGQTRELPRCSAAARRSWRASARRPPDEPAARPRPRSSDAPRVSPAPEAPKSSSAEAEVPLLMLRPLRSVCAGGDSRSTSSGTSDMSDYIETLSLCSSHSSSDTPITMRARVTCTLRPRSGKEYARLAPPAHATHAAHAAHATHAAHAGHNTLRTHAETHTH